MTDLPQTKTRMSLEEFMALPETNLPTEFIDGEVIVSPAPKDPHQDASVELIVSLRHLLPDGKLRHQPTDVHIDGINVLQPDIFWVSDSNSNCNISLDGYWHGAPDLVIEILSPSTALQDKGRKFDLYEQNRVREYWLVDPISLFIEVYIGSNNQFKRIGVFGLKQTFTSSVITGQAVDVNVMFGNKK